MASSKIDKQIKNARLGIERAPGPQARLKAEKNLAEALRLKEEMRGLSR